MSPVRHQVSGTVLSFSLRDEISRVRGELGPAESRVGRTLVKDGPLRVTLVTLDAGGALHEHLADGPITIHVLEGAIEVEAAGTTWPGPSGTLLAIDAGVPHAVRSRDGGLFLLTVVQPDRAGAVG